MPGGSASGGAPPVLKPPAAPVAAAGPAGAITLPPPPPIQLASPGAAFNFGKAPFIWPLFALLDLLGLAAVAVVLRRTWLRAPAD
ncbi:MAG: hypothetical protein JOZ92_02345 [Candidatus Dormibacteraeota bacterium]|nr:hypothetical protein [Candidatus Dormibacteraeota bacterium]